MGSWDWTPRYTQILLAIDDHLRGPLLELRHELGELDEEPLGHLLLESGRITPGQLHLARNLHKAFPQVYLGKILIVQGVLDEDGLEQTLLQPYFRPPGDEFMLRRSALGIFERRLWLGGHLSRSDAEGLKLQKAQALPDSLRPLAELMTLNGELALNRLEYLAETPFATARLRNLLAELGIHDPELLRRLSDERYPVLRLGESDLIPRLRLNNLILHQLRSQLPAVRIQGQSEATGPRRFSLAELAESLAEPGERGLS